MKLVRLEIRNYRSIKEQVESDAIVFDGLDCLVGKNNAGKSNILEVISFLMDKERLSPDLYYKHDCSLTIDVRGYFEVEQSDFDRLKIESKRENFKECLLGDGTIGICRRSDSKQLQLIRPYPTEPRLGPDEFSRFHEVTWDEKDSKNDFRDKMLERYPELENFLTEGKESNKTEWPDAYDRFIEAQPEGVEFTRCPGPPPSGIDADLKNLLPETIFIPAVKEVSDVTKTTRSAELGQLLSQLSSEIQEELDEAIDQAMADVHKRLNIVSKEDTGELLDERHPGIRSIESRISGYVSETFQDISVSLEFPNPESKVLFDNARVWIEEKDFDKFPVSDVGEGVKRVLIFSLIRTLADLRQGDLKIKESEETDQDSQKLRKPLLILYEEAELFLHPGLQKILLRAFEALFKSGDQVIFTTHSPFMLQSSFLSTINLVTKSTEFGTQVLEFHKVLEERDSRTQNRLLLIQNVTSYIFADRVLLVEGVSDRIVIKKLASALSPDWDFERRGIPVLAVTGKGDLPVFRDFLEELGIVPFVLTDIDALKNIVAKLCDSEDVRKCRSQLFTQIQAAIEAGRYTSRIKKKYAKNLAQRYRWDTVFQQLRELYIALEKQESPTEEQMGCLEKLLLLKKEKAEIEALNAHDDPEIQQHVEPLIELLRNEGILVLQGTIEDYYPDGHQSNKVESALEFDPEKYSRNDLCAFYRPLSQDNTTESQDNTTDLEAFLAQVFDD